MKKRVLLSIVSALSLAIVPMASASALTGVTGYISYNGKPASGASVSATCTNKKGKMATGIGVAQSNGDYFIALSPDGRCHKGDTVKVTANYGKISGSNTGTFGSYGTNIKIALVNVALPEMGIFTGIAAATVAGGAFLVIRRRNLAKE